MCGDDDPSWQPLSALPMLTVIAAEGVRLAREHLNNLREAHPYRLDDASVTRVISTWVARVISTWEVTRDDLTNCSRNRVAGSNSRHAVAGGQASASRLRSRRSHAADERSRSRPRNHARRTGQAGV